MITKECYTCGEEYEVDSDELGDDMLIEMDGEFVWLCINCREAIDI